MLLVVLFEGHHLAAMLAAASFATLERYLGPRRPCLQVPLLRSAEPRWSAMPGAFGRVGIGLR
jgi:hypothetical protein